MAIKTRKKFNTWQLLAFAGVFIVAGIAYVAVTQAAGSGPSTYKPPLHRLKHVTYWFSPGTDLVNVSWDRPSDWAKVKLYKLYVNGKQVGSFSTDGAKTPDRTTTAFQVEDTFTTHDSLLLQTEADSAAARAVFRTTKAQR